MSDVEREVVSRLVEAGDLRVHILGWGVVNQPRVIIGDLRVGIKFRMTFDRPAVPVDVHYFDMELRTGSGMLLFKERQSVLYYGKPVKVCAGVYFDMVWDIAIHAMDPKVVKTIKPGAIGLTSRNIDRDTGNLTLMGNRTQMSDNDKKHLHRVRASEAASRVDDARRATKATGMAKADIASGRIKLKD
jgi:hypothetical protein